MFSGLVLLTPKPKQSAEDIDLHRELLHLLLQQGGSSANLGTARSPRSPVPTPNLSLSERSNDDEIEDFAQTSHDQDDDEGLIDNVSSWSPRLNVAKLALDLVKGNGDTTRIVSEAMVSASISEHERIRRRKALVTLLVLIKTNELSSDGYNDEIMRLLNELNIEVTQPTPRPDHDIAHRLSMTQKKLQSRIQLEIEESNTPNGPGSPPMPSQNLERQFNNT